MKKFIKSHWLLSSILLIALTATAAKIGDDLLKIGNPGSTGDKSIVFDVGDGATNPAIVIDYTDKDFSFSKAVKIAGDLLQVGDGTNTDKDVIFDIGNGATNPRFRWDSTNNVILFSSDGSTYKKIGSGGGGGSGINLLQDFNLDFETGAPPTDWTASGGTFTAETGTPLFGAQSGKWDSNAAAQTFDSTLVTIEEGMKGATCNANIYYKYPTGVGSAAGGDYELSLVDDTNALIAGPLPLVLTTGVTSRLAALPAFDCDAVASGQYKLRFTSIVADAEELIVDNAFLGQGGVVHISQTTLVATAHYPTTASCAWTRSADTYGGFPSDADCPSIVVDNSTVPVNTTDDNQPNLVFDYLPPGTYEVTANFTGGTSTGGAAIGYALTDGTTQTGDIHYFMPNSTSTMQFTRVVIGVYTYTTGGPRVFSMQATRHGGGAHNAQINNDSGSKRLQFTVKKYPLNSTEALTLETTGWHVDVNIGGANPSMGFTSQSDYSQIGNSSLDMVINPGSALAQIPCQDGTAPEGLTCDSSAVQENVGVSFHIPSAGRYRVCFEAGISHVAGATGNVNQTLQLIETGISDTIAGQKGRGRQAMFTASVGGVGNGITHPLRTCGTFEFSSAGQRVVRLMFEQVIVGTITQNLVLADRGAAQGNRDIHITVEKMDQQFPTPVFTDLKNSLEGKLESSAANRKVIEAEVGVNSSSISCSISGTNNPGGNIASAAVVDTQDCQFNFAVPFSGEPICIASPLGGLSGAECLVVVRNPAYLKLRSYDQVNNNFINRGCLFRCTGPK